MTSERGTIIIHVALALLGLTLFSAYVIDHGIFYVARRQAQTSADAGALAAMIETMEHPTATPAEVTRIAQQAAFENTVWLEHPQPADVIVTMPITCPPSTGTSGPSCVRVDVERGTTDRLGHAHTNVLPTIFATLAGITSQSISATATAQLAGANAADCLRPWFVLDTPGIGYTTEDIGTDIVLDSRVVTSGFGKIDLANGERGVEDAVYQCAPGGEAVVGQTVNTQTGAAGHPTARAVNDVIDWDFNAHYNPLTKSVEGSCAPQCACPPYAMCPNGNRMSPRVFVAPLCAPVGDPGCVSGGNGPTHQITITKFLSFFIVSATAHGGDIEIHAILVGGAGDIKAGPDDPGGFLQVVRLVR